MRLSKVINIERNKKLYTLGIFFAFVIAICLRLYVVDFNRTIADGDERCYSNAAENLLKYGMFVIDRDGSVLEGKKEPEATSALQIGYPVIISILYAIFGHQEKVVFVFQFILSVLDIGLIWTIMSQCKLKKRAILISLFLTAVYPGFIYNIDRMLTEQVFKTSLLLFVCIFFHALKTERTWIYFFSGICLGVATFIRGLAFPFLFLSLVIISFYVAKNRGKKACAFTAAYVLTQAWWWIRNFMHFHKFILLSEAGDGPKIWGMMPYYLDMSSSENLTTLDLLTANKTINFPLYIRWRIFGCINYMWNDIWDEGMVHSSLRGGCGYIF